MKSELLSLFSGKTFLENAVKIILKKSETKSRVILIFFREIFLVVSAAELINSLFKIIMNNKQTKPQQKKVFWGAKQRK